MKTLLLALLLCSVSCTSTVRPKIVQSKAASFDNNAQNSGVIAFNPDGSILITQHARDRYNDLLLWYGDRFHPQINDFDTGLTKVGTNWVMTAEYAVKFSQMNRWSKSDKGKLPK